MTPPSGSIAEVAGTLAYPAENVGSSRTLRKVLSRLAPFGAALFAGGLFALSCPPHGWSLLAWLVPGLLLVSARQLRLHEAFLCGVLYAVTIGTLITSWAPHAAVEYFLLKPITAHLFILGVHVLNPGIPCGLLVLLYAVSCRRVSHANFPIIGALLWVGSEWLRTWSLGWELLSHSQFANLTLIQIADVGGAYAVSFVMTLCSIALFELLNELRRNGLALRVAVRRLSLPAASLGATLLYGLGSLYVHGTGKEEHGVVDRDSRNIAVVQGNVPNQFRWKRAFFGKTLATYAELTNKTRGASPDLIVWPENAVNFYMNQDWLLHSQLRTVAAVANDGLLVGAPRRGDGREAYNSAYLLGADGETKAIYDKVRLLPFGEYNPLPWFGADDSGNEPVYFPGAHPQILSTDRLRVGPMICFEVLYPGITRELVRDGAQILVNLSNDSWMDDGGGAALEQHFSMAVFRAVEARRSLVRAASSGVSGFVSPTGETYSLLASHQAGAVTAPVRLSSGQTLYVRWGDSWIVAGLLLCLATVVRGRRQSA